jgi:hypothetical protein
MRDGRRLGIDQRNAGDAPDISSCRPKAATKVTKLGRSFSSSQSFLISNHQREPGTITKNEHEPVLVYFLFVAAAAT